MPSGRRAKAQLIIKGFTDPDLVDIESHSPTLTWEGFMTVLQSVCSHGHKLQFGDVQEAFNTGDQIKRERPLFVRMPPMESLMSPVMFGCSCSRQVMDWLTARENGGIVFLLFGAEKCTTGIPWYHWSGRRRHCWWGRRSLGTGHH